MMPQSSVECLMKRIEEHILETFPFCFLNHMLKRNFGSRIEVLERS